jgi:hypothetical protein
MTLAPEPPTAKPVTGPPPPPPLTRVLVGHLVFTVLHQNLFANVLWLIPMLVRLHFGAENETVRDWQTTFVTTAMPAAMIFAVFWGELVRRVSTRTYLAIFWAATVLPFGCVGFVQNYTQLLICHVIATIGLAGWAPVNGHLLKLFYPDALRGRVYGVLSVAAQAAGATSVYFVGLWLEANPSAFRLFFPLAALVELGGLLFLMFLTPLGKSSAMVLSRRKRSLKRIVRPVFQMGRILWADKTFLRYEAAFMTYGAAFMICDAMLPVLSTVQVGMRYEEYSQSTQMVTKLVMLVMIFPMGVLLDRIGPVRLSGLAFGTLTLYPLLLLTATDAGGVKLASVAWGLGLSGVMMGWMLGPVALARRPNKVPQYVAIHATLVGVRGVLFQALAMGLYKLTGTFTWPLGIAALGFAWGAVQMWQLQGAIRRRLREREAEAGAEARSPAGGKGQPR